MIDDTLNDTAELAQPNQRRSKRSRKSARRKGESGGQQATRRPGLRGRAVRVMDQGSRVLSSAAASMSNVANTARGFASEMQIPGRRSFESMVESNPLILGAIGLGLGMVIGTLLPRNSMDSGMQAIGLESSSSRSGGGRSHQGAKPRSGRSTKRASARKPSRKRPG
jgi:hypothetical protein